MKRNLTNLFIIIILITCCSNIYAFPGVPLSNSNEVRTFTTFTFTKISGYNYLDLSIYISDKNANTTLGISSFVIKYDSNSLSYQPGLLAKAPINPGYFSFGLKSYLDPITVPYGPNCHSLETTCDDSSALIPDTPALVGTIRFRIINPSESAGFSWEKDFSAIYDGQRREITNLEYINPETISLSAMDLDFHADLSDNKVLLLDKLTQSERSEKGIVIEKSRDGINFESFDPLIKSGNNTQDSEYAAYDEHPFSGTSFYRLSSKNKSGEKELLGMTIVHRPK